MEAFAKVTYWAN